MDKVTYKNRNVEYEATPTPKIQIDEKSVQVGHDPEANEYNAVELPYRSFKSVKELAEAIVDQRAQSE